jgi:hypothetical protein
LPEAAKNARELRRALQLLNTRNTVVTRRDKTGRRAAQKSTAAVR